MSNASAYIAKVRKHAEEARTFFSNSQKVQRERAVCRAFLRAIGLRFSDDEIIAPCIEPVDVSFRDAHFQVRIHLAGRRPDDEWKQRRNRWNKARRLSDLLEPATPWPTPMRRNELVSTVTDALKSKSKKYGSGGCSNIDALVYADITSTRFLLPRSLACDVSRLEQQGWRSISVLFPPYGTVLFAHDSAPRFLRELAGKTRNAWRRFDGLFDTQETSTPQK